MPIKISNNLLTTLLIIYLLVYLVSNQQQNNQQISTCLGNCMYCDPSAPQICLDKNLSNKEAILCLPFYRGMNCQSQTFAYQNVVKQDTNFTDWNIIKSSNYQLVKINPNTSQLVADETKNYSSLGPISSNQNLYTIINLPSNFANERLVVKLSLGIDDSTIQNYFNSQQSVSNPSSSSNSSASSTETKIQTLPNGTQIITIITTTNTTTSTNGSVSSQTFNGRKFMYVQLIDQNNSQAIIQRKSLSYSQLSKIRTSAGYVYTFQLGFDLLKQYVQVGLKMYLVNPTTDQKAVQWSLLSFDANAGCRGYVVSSYTVGSYSCDACLSGFYPSYSLVSGQVQQCRNCDYRCKTCLSFNTCLTCIQNTVFNQNSGMCEYSQFFNALGGYNIVNGKLVQTGGMFSQNVIKTEGGIVQISQPLINYQSYTVYLDFLYTAAFRNSGQTVRVMINGQQYSFNSLTLPLTVSSIVPGISSTSTNIYQHRLNFKVNGVNENSWLANGGGSSSSNSSSNSSTNSSSNSTSNQSLNSTSNITINGSSTVNISKDSNIKIIVGAAQTGGISSQQVGITNVKLVQFKCSKNCLQCQYSQFTQTSQCTKCNYFFDLNSNCLNAANGFYIAVVDSVQQCIKCHSTCKQCSGPQIQDCIDCFDGFRLGSIIYNYNCINCLNQVHNNKSNPYFVPSCKQAPTCLNDHPLNKLLTNQNCQACLNSKNDSLTSSIVCRNCWLQQNLARSFCEPIPERGYQLYGSDISQGVVSTQWTSNKILIKKSLDGFYKDLYGVDYETISSNQTTSMLFTQSFLPAHRGLTIFFTLFKINTWYQGAGTAGSILGHYINILIRSEGYNIKNQTISINNAFGNNIYGGFGSGNQMIYTFLGNYQQHTYTGKTQIIITASHSGIFVRDLEFYLGNCQECNGNKMNFEVYYIPMYSTNDTQTGLDVWLTFNQGVKFVSSNQNIQNQILNSFQFSIDQLDYSNLIPFVILDNKINQWNYVKYFLPINSSLLNATLRINNSMGYNIYSKVSKAEAYLTNPLIQNKPRNLVQEFSTITSENDQSYNRRMLLNQRLSPTNVQQKIYRYEDIKLDERRSMDQMNSFYEFFQWFTLFTMIVFAFFGFGVIFEEFSILIQLLFLHIYTSTNLLPATFKRPLSYMQKMENLNFFAYPHAKGIQDGWFEKVIQKSPYPLTQYNVDVYFARSLYPIIIINLIYLFWFLVLFALLKVSDKFKSSENKIVKLFRNIPQRPMNYFDSIWRYQFITVMWASFIQFWNFDGPTAQMRLNLALCISAFVIALVWPVLVMVYTYSQHFLLNVEHFIYLYNDIYYRKIPSVTDKTRYYLYIAVRFGRYFFFALFIAVFIYQNIIGPAILLAITLLQIIYIIKLKIFTDKIYLVFKVIQNIGFIVLQILLLIVYGFSDDTITETGFISIGYGIGALYILMIVNGIARFIYLGYKKIKQFLTDRYDYGQKGKLVNYDNKNPVTLIELPTTQRGLI